MRYQILTAGYSNEESNAFRKYLLNAKISFLLDNAVSETEIVSMMKKKPYDYLMIHPRLLDFLSYINILRCIKEVPVLLLSPEYGQKIVADFFIFQKMETSSSCSCFVDLVNDSALTVIKAADLEVRIEHRTVFVNRKEIKLTSTEFDLLALLIANQKRVFTYEMIMDLIWHENYDFFSRKAINNHVSNLRKKIHAVSDAYDYIVCVHGVGYKFDINKIKREDLDK